MSSQAAYALWERRKKPVEDLPGEEWRGAPGYPGYWVSNLGRAKSKHGLLSPHLHKEQSRFYIAPSVGGRQDGPVAMQVLVCEAFHGPRPLGMEVAHLNGDSTDNRAENLKWATRLENQRHRREHGTDNRGERNGRSKLTNAQVQEIVASGEPDGVLAARFGVNKSHINNLRAGRRGPKSEPRGNAPSDGRRLSPEVAQAMDMIRDGMRPRDAAIAAGANLTSVRCRVTIERKAGRIP